MKMLFLFILLNPFIKTFANDLLQPDTSLIRQWNQDFYEKHNYQPFPKIVYFKNVKNQKAVVFVGTKHKDWKNSQEKIKTAIENENPEIILIEGIAKSDGLSPRIWDDKIKQSLEREGFEGYFAYKLALQKRIPFAGSELEGAMSEHTSYERDIAVVNRLAELLAQYNRVLVVYGAGHFVQQELVLTKMLGAPSDVR